MALRANKWLVIFGLLIVSFLVSHFFISGTDQKTGVAILIFIGGLWVTEAVPLAATVFAFSSNEFTIGKMMKTGFLLNIIAIILIWLVTSIRFLNPF